jgi:hypothetical protein
LKKRSKKLLFTAGSGPAAANARRSKSFLLLFFKKEALSFYASAVCLLEPFQPAKAEAV